MSFELTSERLQEIAVGCVSQFMNKQASLSEAIAKEAQELELNPEQTKRVIEATNTIAYLRQLEKSADRTFEFDVADYDHVMSSMCLPEDMAKQAGTPPWLDKDKDSKEDSKEDDKGEKKDSKDKDDEDEKKHKGEDFGKSEKKESKEDDEDEDDEDSEEDKQEKRAMLNKAFFQAKGQLEKMAYDEITICMDLVSAAQVVARDPLGFEKIAFISEGPDLERLTKLCGLEKKADQNLVLTNSELVDVKKLMTKLAEAEKFAKDKAAIEDFVKRAEQVLFHKTANVEKLAGLGSVVAKSVEYIGKSIGRPIGNLVKSTAGVGANMVKNVGAFNAAGKAKGFKSSNEAVKAFDKIHAEKGMQAAKQQFRGTKPSLIAHRVGVGGLLTATAGMGMTHTNNVKDI